MFHIKSIDPDGDVYMKGDTPFASTLLKDLVGSLVSLKEKKREGYKIEITYTNEQARVKERKHNE